MLKEAFEQQSLIIRIQRIECLFAKLSSIVSTRNVKLRRYKSLTIAQDLEAELATGRPFVTCQCILLQLNRNFITTRLQAVPCRWWCVPTRHKLTECSPKMCSSSCTLKFYCKQEGPPVGGIWRDAALLKRNCVRNHADRQTSKYIGISVVGNPKARSWFPNKCQYKVWFYVSPFVRNFNVNLWFPNSIPRLGLGGLRWSKMGVSHWLSKRLLQLTTRRMCCLWCVEDGKSTWAPFSESRKQ